MARWKATEVQRMARERVMAEWPRLQTRLFVPVVAAHSRKERSRGSDSRSFCRFVAALFAIMSSRWQTGRPSTSTRRATHLWSARFHQAQR